MDIEINDPAYLETALKSLLGQLSHKLIPNWSDSLKKAATQANNVIKASKHLSQKGDWQF
ncbi:MAG: hypothetical protein IPK76_09725 [Lewinellaceae bacterium]|nr:hypothetical protein [Lewinellaceae bacterium]